MKTAKRYIKAAMATLIVVILVLHAGGPAASARPAPEDVVNKRLYGVRNHSATSPDMRNILSVLEERVADGKMLEKAKEKLATLDGENLRLIASLCERIEVRGHDDARAGIAFLMAAMLVVLS